MTDTDTQTTDDTDRRIVELITEGHKLADRVREVERDAGSVWQELRNLRIMAMRVWGFITVNGYCPVCDGSRPEDSDNVVHVPKCPMVLLEAEAKEAGQGEEAPT